MIYARITINNVLCRLQIADCRLQIADEEASDLLLGEFVWLAQLPSQHILPSSLS